MQREPSQPDLFTPPPIQTVSPANPLGESRATAGLTGASDSAGIAVLAPALEPARAVREIIPPPPREPIPPTGAASPLLARLTDEHLNYQPVGSRFESIAAQTLDNAGTNEDGFDDIHSAVLQSFGDDTPALPSLDQHLADADFTPGEFSDAYHAPIIAEVQPLLDAGDGALGDLAGSFNGVIAPPPPPSNELPVGAFSNVPGHPGGGLFNSDGDFINWWNADPGDGGNLPIEKTNG